ncbi:HEAT repeat domain-containing protein [Streptomyces luteocolor]|uniref:HEAT repeat domain-containing protein n=1 Tax=Streptomyces luteocolor TaxID=285500 RepID=UPI00099F9A4B|nr:HEAT repeat domain-containing protein [Streptomyces luteocolor]
MAPDEAVPELIRMRLAGDVAGLRRSLRSEDVSTALRAAELLGDIGGPEACEALLHCLAMPGRYPRHLELWVISPLARLGERRAVPFLLRRLREGLPENTSWPETLYGALGTLGGPEVVRELVERLAGPRPSKYVVDAVAALRPPEAVPALLAALWTLLPWDEVHAVRALGAMRDPRTGAPLLFLVDSEGTSPPLRRAAVAALADLPEESWPPPAGWIPEIMLRRALRDPDAATAAPAAELLARTKTGRDELRGGLMDSVPGRRAPYRVPDCVAVTVCGFIQKRPDLFGEEQDYRDVPTLIELLDAAAVPTVRRAAAGALGAVGGTVATQALLAALGDRRVGEAVARAMARLPRPPVRDLLALLSGTGDATQRLYAAEALGHLEHTAAAPLLLSTALGEEEPPKLRAAAVDALAALRHRPAAAGLATLAEDAELPGTLRSRALHALGRIGARESLPAVLAAVREASATVRLQAAKALGAFPGAEAAEALGALAARDADRDVARAAVRALGRIGAPAAPVLASLTRPLRPELADDLIAALAGCPGPEAVAGLCELTDPTHPEEVHVAVAAALGERGDPAAARPLTALLTDDHWACRDAALPALTSLDTEEADTYVLTHPHPPHRDRTALRAALTVIAGRRGPRLAEPRSNGADG